MSDAPSAPPIVAPPVGSARSDRRGRRSDGFRADIEGLRAIAVVAVVAYHLSLPGFSGGFVGVDVFFVISGYLITSHLVRDATADHRVQFREFYARRVRRILPAATLVLVATIGAAMIWQNPLGLAQTTGGDARSAALFVSNLRFESQATDYLAESGGVSLFQQFWSLSVEEQFYLLWPGIMAVAVVLAARRTRSIRRWVALALGVVVLGSFAVSWHASESDPIPAFYLLESRAWEMGVGALLAVAGTRVARIAPSARGATAAIGAAAIVAAVVLFDDATTGPGLAATIPVLGTAGVIAGGTGGPGRVGQVLSVRPAQTTGRYSYSLYLWHWPLVVLVAGVEPSLWRCAVVVAATAALAAFSLHVVEQPVRRSPWLRAHTSASLALGLGLVLVGVVASFVPVVFAPALDAGRPALAAAHVPGRPPVPTDFVPSDLEPALVDGTSSVDPYAERNVDCGELGACAYGEPDAPVRIVLLGDSHAGHWTPALAELATANGWRVDRVTRSGCSSLTSVGVPECGDWLRRQWASVRALDPDLVVLSSASDGQYANGPTAWEQRLRQTLRNLPRGVPVAVLSETPRSASSVPECLADHLQDVASCEPSWPAARTVDINDRLRALTARTGVDFVDLTSLLCLADRCPAVAGNVLVYRDAHHLTTTFARTRAGDLGRELAPLVP